MDKLISSTKFNADFRANRAASRRSQLAKLALLVAAVPGSLLAFQQASAEEVRYYQQNGVTYRETRRVVQQPVIQTQMQEREVTVYREKLHTEYDEDYRTCLTPVIEYRYVPHLRGRWNPFVQPYYTYHLVPVQRYQASQAIVRTPVVHRELVPETRIVQVPVTTQRVAQKEIITRVAVSTPAPQTLPPGGVPASQSNVGGIAQLKNDPPRHASGGWRAAGSPTVRR